MGKQYSVVTKITANISDFMANMKKAEDKAQGLNKKVKDSLDKVGNGFKNTGTNMTKYLTVPLAGIGGLMMRTGIDFEKSMSNVQAISGATSGDLEKLKSKAREMGKNTSKSASEAADALGYMALAGWDTNQMMDGLEPILRLSEAGNLDLARASDLVTDSMSALGIETKDLPGYLDKVAQASRNSNTDVDSLMEAFLISGGTFKNFNVPIEEASALLGVLANRGFKGAEAGTAMNAIMTNLTSGTGAAGKALEELGISAFDSEGNFKGMETVLREVKDKMAGMTDEQKAQYISMIAGKEHMKTFNGLMSGLGDEYQGLKGDITDSDGALNDMASTMQDNAQGKIEQLKSALGELSIVVSEKIIPYFTKIVEKVTDVINWFSGLDDGIQNTILIIAGIVGVIGPVLVVFGAIASGISAIIGVVTTLAPLFGVLVGAIGAISAPVLIVVGIIAALVAIGVALWKNWDTVKAKAKEIWSSVTKTVSEMASKVSNKFNEMKDKAIQKVTDLKNKAVEGFSNLGNGIKNKAIDAKNKVVSTVTSLKDGFISKVNSLKSSVVNSFVNLGNGIKQKVSDAKNKVISYAENLREGFVSKANSLKSSATDIFNSVKSAIVNPINKARDLVKSAIDKIKGFFSGLSGKLKFKIPKPKLPHFSIKGKLSLKPPSVPSIGINWHAKGGIFNKPTLFNTSNGVHGVGEAGSEAIIPLKPSVLGQIGKMIANTMDLDMGSRINSLINSFDPRSIISAMQSNENQQMQNKMNQSDNVVEKNITINPSFTYNIDGNADERMLQKNADYTINKLRKEFGNIGVNI
ncbi:phage tail tape measure protein [Virgibacillus sp. SK37]|uniref:phage tail tape measure protein n=1 Tax=Virgibacillus sp. SK37 TaxID=403957 RepID=UPI0004D130D4|nr:phage tail tape measure protein [Virgibacillus sp. SK37]AIF45436.1 hypothetical protein X953_10185 [Virgibacillus sp. SK37]